MVAHYDYSIYEDFIKAELTPKEKQKIKMVNFLKSYLVGMTSLSYAEVK